MRRHAMFSDDTTKAQQNFHPIQMQLKAKSLQNASLSTSLHSMQHTQKFCGVLLCTLAPSGVPFSTPFPLI